jgi:hypothetical protein
MYLERGITPACGTLPSTCPAGWTQADLGSDIAAGGTNCRRTCFRIDRACLVMRLERTDTTGATDACTAVTPPACPVGWSQADVGDVDDALYKNCRRTCFICP